MTSTDSIQKFENSRHLFVGGGCFDATSGWTE